jgi:uncharacterized protein (DUF983 family)
MEIWRYICVYILGSVHTAVMCVIKKSVKKEIWRHICVYILGSVLLTVMYVIKHSVTKVVEGTSK